MKEFKRDGNRGRKSSGRGFKKSRGSFGDSSESSGRKSGGRSRRDSGRSERKPLEFHQVICAKCGTDCEVPFKPTSNKPVFCSDCFKKNDSSFSNSDSKPRNKSGSSDDLAKIHEKLDKIMEALDID